MRNRPFIILDSSLIAEKDWHERFWEEDVEEVRNPLSSTEFGFLELASGGTLVLKNIDGLILSLQERLKEFLCSKLGMKCEDLMMRI